MKSPTPECVIPHVAALGTVVVIALDPEKPYFNLQWTLIVLAIYPTFKAIQVFWMALALLMQGRYLKVKFEDSNE